MKQLPEIALRDTSLQRMHGNFMTAAENLVLQELAVIPEGRNIPRSLGQFALIPIIGHPHLGYNNRPGEHYDLAPLIQTTYGAARMNRPYMDAEFGLGLIRNKWLVALSTALLDDNGNIQINQIQDVSGTGSKYGRMQRNERYKTGLHDGFLWRDTFIASWIQLAIDLDIGDKVIVQGAFNNYWLDRTSTAQLERAYDTVAERMGFTKNEQHNWEVELYANDFVWPDSTGY